MWYLCVYLENINKENKRVRHREENQAEAEGEREEREKRPTLVVWLR